MLVICSLVTCIIIIIIIIVIVISIVIIIIIIAYTYAQICIPNHHYVAMCGRSVYTVRILSEQLTRTAHIHTHRRIHDVHKQFLYFGNLIPPMGIKF